LPSLKTNIGGTPARGVPVALLLGLVALATLLPLLMLGAFSLSTYVEAERAAQISSLERHADSLARTVDRELRGHMETAQVLAGSRQLADGELRVFEELARDAAAMAGGHFILMDRSFQQLVNTRSERSAALPRTANPAAVARVFESGRPEVGDLGQGAVARSMLFAVRVPVRVAREVPYVLAYVPDPQTLPNLLAETYRPEGWFAGITDTSGRIVARSHDHAEFFGRQIPTEIMQRLAGPAGVLATVDLEGRPSSTAFHRSRLGGWTVFVWAPNAVLQKPADRAFWVIIALSAVALAVSVLVAYITGRFVARPTLRLVEAAHDLGRRQPVQFAPSHMREANVVGHALVEASRDIDFVMRELSHRSKNLLAVVQAIARQTGLSATDQKEFLTRFSQRLAGLASSHDLLVERDWRGVFLVDLAQAQVQAFLDETDTRVSVSGPPVLLTPTAAQHIGMAFHELSTNAFKHGALSVASGRVEITWTWEPAEDGEEQLCLQWKESGGPIVGPPSHKGFGHVVVERMVASGVGGTARFAWKPEGIVWTLKSPASSVAERAF
jgi:two-component sensor histidine kinase